MHDDVSYYSAPPNGRGFAMEPTDRETKEASAVGSGYVDIAEDLSQRR
jgi:hypothetical protein